MHFEGVVTIKAPRERVWRFLTDPYAVSQCAPGVESLEVIAPDHKFRAVASVGLGTVRARFTGDVEWLDVDPPNRATMKVHGVAPGSAMDATSEMVLMDGANGATDMKWAVEITVVGTIASTAARVMGGVTQKLTGAFFDCVKKRIEVEVAAEMVLIPEGPFLMGEGEAVHSITVPAFYIARHPITNADYAAFVAASGYRPPPHWPGEQCPEALSRHPVVNVSWHEALAYCHWLSAATGYHYRLPTEAEWEKAARGTDGRAYPWGNDFDPTKCNCLESGIGGATPVDGYANGSSPYGIVDMVGNVWEWCSSVYANVPYRADDGREDPAAPGGRVLRGGSWLNRAAGVHAARRLSALPEFLAPNIGFRVARGA
jgi:formylglycine-generating enzyme required for sulfatase activity